MYMCKTYASASDCYESGNKVRAMFFDWLMRTRFETTAADWLMHSAKNWRERVRGIFKLTGHVIMERLSQLW